MNWAAVFERASNFLIAFFSPGVISGLIAAFLIAGAINVFIPKALVTKFLGSKSNNVLAYTLAISAGILISV